MLKLASLVPPAPDELGLDALTLDVGPRKSALVQERAALGSSTQHLHGTVPEGPCHQASRHG